MRYEPGHFADYDLLLEYLLFLDALRPGLVYVVNVRSPDDAARSGWWPDHGDAATVLADTRERLVRVTADLAQVLGEDRVVLLDYDRWSQDPDVLINGLASVGLPRDDDAVREVLAERLVHGRPGAGTGS